MPVSSLISTPNIISRSVVKLIIWLAVWHLTDYSPIKNDIFFNERFYVVVKWFVTSPYDEEFGFTPNPHNQ